MSLPRHFHLGWMCVFAVAVDIDVGILCVSHFLYTWNSSKYMEHEYMMCVSLGIIDGISQTRNDIVAFFLITFDDVRRTCCCCCDVVYVSSALHMLLMLMPVKPASIGWFLPLVNCDCNKLPRIYMRHTMHLFWIWLNLMMLFIFNRFSLIRLPLIFCNNNNAIIFPCFGKTMKHISTLLCCRQATRIFHCYPYPFTIYHCFLPPHHPLPSTNQEKSTENTVSSM